MGGSETYYFTDNEYNNGSGVFTIGEGVWSYTTPVAGISAGDAISMVEDITTSNVLSLTCSVGSGDTCGTITMVSGFFALSSSSYEGVYAYTDSDSNPENGVSEIYSVFYTQDNIPALEDPTPDFPNAIVVDGLTSDGFHDHFDWITSRSNVPKSALSDPDNYSASTGNIVLSTEPFTFELP